MTRLFIKHPVSTWMVFTAFVVLAIYAVPRIEVEAIPAVDLPSLTVETRWQGASPKAIQQTITLPVEEAARNVHGVESMVSMSRTGRSTVQVEFRRDINIEFARLDLNEQLGTLRRNLPLNASQPAIFSYVPEDFQTDSFFTFSIESDLSSDDLREKAEKWIVPQILVVDGVADAQVIGGSRPLLKILLDRERLELYGVSADEVFLALNRLDELSGAGLVRRDGLDSLVALRQPVDLDVIREAIVARRGGRSYTLEMLGEVRPGHEDPVRFVRSNGLNVVQVQVEKRSGSNSVSVSRNLRRALPQIEERMPFAATLNVDADEGEQLEQKLEELVGRSVVILVLLFMLLVITLRQVQLTAIVIASIVFALVICLSLFYFLGLSVNFITISGLTICFGMLLDNSILVLDSIHRRLQGMRRANEAGLTRQSKLRVAQETIVAGTGDVMFPIMATTLTTVVAFLSFIYLSGRLALYYVPLAISVGLAMVASIFVAFGWIPVVLNQTWAKRMVRRSKDGDKEVTELAEVHSYVEDLPDLKSKPGWFQRIVMWNQSLWWLLIPALLFLMYWGWGVYDEKVYKGGFYSPPSKEELVFFMRMPAGTDVEVTAETAIKFEQALMPIREGATERFQIFGDMAYMVIEFDDKLLRSGIPMLYRARLTELADATGNTFIFIRGFAEQPYVKGRFGGTSYNSTIKITGYNSKRLAEIADRNLAKVQRNRRVRKSRVTGSEGFGRGSDDETVIALNRDSLADHGLTVVDVVGHLRRLLGVDTPWGMRIDGQEERVQLSFSDAESIEFSAIAQQAIDTPDGEKVQLGDLMSMQTLPLSDEIRRENQRYSLMVNWEYIGTDRMRTSFIKSVLDSMDLPYGYSAEEAQQQFLTEEEESDLKKTLWLAAGFILMVMTALFESLMIPLLVLTSLPLAMLGVALVYWQTSSTFDSSAQIGLVLLFGVVVNNAILLVSRFRTEAFLILKAKLGGNPSAETALFPGGHRAMGAGAMWHLPKKERGPLLRRAVARGTQVRLRSILLTSGTTVVSLVPLLIQVERVAWKPDWLFGIELPVTLKWLGSGNQDIWQNLALTSIGGLISSTILILICIPPLYYFSVRFGWAMRRIAGWIAAAWRWIMAKTVRRAVQSVG